LADYRRGSDFRGFSSLVRNPVQRLLPALIPAAGGTDPARRGIRVSQQGREPEMAEILGLVHLWGQPGSSTAAWGSLCQPGTRVPIDASMQYAGGFFNLLNPYALLGGLTTVLVFLLHGAIFLSMKLTGKLMERAQMMARRVWLPVVIVLLIFLIGTYLSTDILERLGINPGIVPLSGVAAVLLARYFIHRKMDGWAFGMTCITIAFALVTMFMILFPRVMISSLNPDWSLTIYNASSSEYTLRVMSIVALIFVPIVLIYQGWSYWVFRKRIETRAETLTY
jgi:cytochrome bd-type quinol oxidase subunit 2